jgi:hypothetical protein
MHKRLSLLWALAVVGAALCLPSSSFAGGSGFDQIVIYNNCNGANPRLRVKNVAEGSTTANRLTNETWVEKKSGQGGPWSKIYTWDVAKYKYTINGDTHWLTSWRTWQGDQHNWYRIGFRARAWHNKTLLSSVVLYSVRC